MSPGASGRGVVRTLDFPFHLVDRKAYDHLWLRLAIRAGATFRPGAHVVSVDPQKNEVLTADGDTHRGRFIVAADGVHSRVRRSLERRRLIPAATRGQTAVALEAFVPNEAVAGLPDHPAIFYGHLPWGYAWSFPGNGHRVLGIAGLRTRTDRRLRSAFNAFRASLSLPRGLKVRTAGHSLPYGNYLEAPGHGSILLVGDAAGLADPFLGEGIYYAHRSGALAADAILEAAGRGRTAAGCYADRLQRTILPEMRYARAGRNLIFSLPPRLYYPVLGAALRLAPKICEETIQGPADLPMASEGEGVSAGTISHRRLQPLALDSPLKFSLSISCVGSPYRSTVFVFHGVAVVSMDTKPSDACGPHPLIRSAAK